MVKTEIDQRLIDGLADIDVSGGMGIYETSKLLREKGIKHGPMELISTVQRVLKGELGEEKSDTTEG